jgi:hypothetical protein
MGNSGLQHFLPWLKRLSTPTQAAPPPVRAAAAWALARLSSQKPGSSQL